MIFKAETISRPILRGCVEGFLPLCYCFIGVSGLRTVCGRIQDKHQGDHADCTDGEAPEYIFLGRVKHGQENGVKDGF